MVARRVTRYQIAEPLGAGGMGEVYLAHDTRLNRQVAIKRLPKTGADEDAQKRMLREARMVATIDHPNVCTIFEIGEDDDGPFIVMQYVQGETLADRIARGPLTVDEVAAISRQVAAALAEAHSRGVVHRDIKPGNIMITPSRLVKVLDFGLAKSFEGDDEGAATEIMISTPGLVAGTVPYMSPEQLRAEALDGRSDIFSFGVVMYEMAAGSRPFDRPTVAATINAVLRDEPPPLPEEMSALQRVVRRALAKTASKRFQNAAELEQALVKLPKRRKASTTTRRKVKEPSQIMAIAVLPLSAEIADESMAYLEEGLHDRIIARLSQIPRLRIVRYRALTGVADLGVQAVLTGRLVATPSSLDLHLEMTAPESGAPIWSTHIERSGREIEAVAVEVAAQVGDTIRAKSNTSTTGRRRKTTVLSIDPAAEKLYLRGRVQWNKRHVEGVRQAIVSFQEAVEIDPLYANAHAGLADAYFMLAFLGAMATANSVPKGKAAAMRAIELDPTLAEPHASLGYAAAFLEWDAPVARREFEEALRLNPNYSWAVHWYGLFLAPFGTFEESVRYVTLARELDPLSPIVTTVVGIPYHLHRQYDEAVRIYAGVLESEPQFAPAHFYIGQALEELGRYEQALDHLQRAREIAGEITTFGGALAHCLARSGARDRAIELLGQLEQQSKQRFVSPYHFMLAHLGLGDMEEALNFFQLALEQRAALLYWTPRDPRFDPLRGHPRFDELASRYRLKGEIT